MADGGVTAMYFSPTGTTKKVVTRIAETISGTLGQPRPFTEIDFTLPAARNREVSFPREEIVVLGTPVYAGRVPNILLKYLNTIQGNGARAIAIVLYGNRNYDDALVELVDLLDERGCAAVAAGAFVGEHAFSRILAKDRPDDEDMALATRFALDVSKKLARLLPDGKVAVRGNRPYGKYYVPKSPDGEPVDIRKVKPKTSAECNDCKRCVEVCPMGSIDPDDVSNVVGICIKCGACVKACPVGAKYYDDAGYLRHKHELEVEFARRREPELFV